MKRAAFIAAALMASSTALADGTYMWGGGLVMGSIVVPGAYPSYFPSVTYGEEKTNISDLQGSTLSQVGGDFHIGLEGVYYLDGGNRVGLYTTTTLFSGDFKDRNFMLKYAKVQDFGAADGVLGAGAGVGRSSWEGEGDEELMISHYPLRAEVGVMHREKEWAVQALLYGQYNLEANNRTYTNANGVAADDVGRGVYAMLGFDLTAMIGDFKPPSSSSKKNSGSSGSSGGNKNSGGSGSGSKDSGSKDSGGKDSGGKDSGGKDSGGKDSGGKDSGGKDSGGKGGGGKGDGGKGDGAKGDGAKGDGAKGDK
jgi:hypothetical protein